MGDNPCIRQQGRRHRLRPPMGKRDRPPAWPAPIFFRRSSPIARASSASMPATASTTRQCGNPAGVPVLFLHGGPGAGATAAHRRFFDPSFYRIVIFDQRGAGRSTPVADIVDNTTPLLIADIEALRQTLNVERWLLFGGSWGSTLALAYGEAHPERCLGFVLRGIFLRRQSEVDWFLDGLQATFFPEAHRAFVEFLPAAERGDRARKLLQAPDRSRSRGPSPGGARLVSSYEAAVLDPAAQCRQRRGGERRPRRPGAGADRGALLPQPHLPAARIALHRQRRRASAHLPARSCTAATTWSARSTTRRRRWPAPGRAPSTSSSPTPATPRWNPASAARWWARPSGSAPVVRPCCRDF